MARETTLGGAAELPEDDDRGLRPARMADMVGQRETAARLQIALDAARKRGEPLGHILFDGPPGLGKTTFARCLPNEMGVSLQLAVGAGLKAPKDLVPYLTNLTENSVLFIDEIHRVPRSVEEYLYTSMEDFLFLNPKIIPAANPPLPTGEITRSKSSSEISSPRLEFPFETQHHFHTFFICY